MVPTTNRQGKQSPDRQNGILNIRIAAGDASPARRPQELRAMFENDERRHASAARRR